MALNAVRDGYTLISEAVFNSLLSLQDFDFIYEGTQQDGMTDTGVTEHLVADYNHAIKFTTGTGKTDVTRIELDVATDGTGADLTVEIRGNDFNPDGSAEGTLLKTVVIPSEFLPASQAYWSIPINVIDLTAATVYWIIVKQGGSASNHVHLYSKGSEKDAAHRCYRRNGSSGAWTDISDSIRFKVFEGAAGDLLHGIYGTNGYTTVEYNGELMSKVYRYLPYVDTPDGGIRDIQTYTWSGEYLTKGVTA